MSHDSSIVTPGQTFILAGYTVPCSGTVVAWEFCYQRSSLTSATFYPGIWRITETSNGTDFTLVQSNNVTYDSSVHDPQDPISNFPCQRFNISDIDQFTVPAGSVVGLYIPITPRPLLLRTISNMSITIHKFSGNQSNVSINGNSDVDYNIAIRVHLGMYVCMYTYLYSYLATCVCKVCDVS